MKITLVDGSKSDYSNPTFTSDLACELIKLGHEVRLLLTSKMKINYCTGCWNCWWKTPGECIHKDDMPELYRNYMSSDLVLHFSPLEIGFITSQLKKVNDRTIPLIHPYGALVQNECHHMKRYDKYPMMGLIVDPVDADKEDLKITNDLYKRMALNFKSELKLFTTINTPLKELTHAISNI